MDTWIHVQQKKRIPRKVGYSMVWWCAVNGYALLVLQPYSHSYGRKSASTVESTLTNPVRQVHYIFLLFTFFRSLVRNETMLKNVNLRKFCAIWIEDDSLRLRLRWVPWDWDERNFSTLTFNRQIRNTCIVVKMPVDRKRGCLLCTSKILHESNIEVCSLIYTIEKPTHL